MHFGDFLSRTVLRISNEFLNLPLSRILSSQRICCIRNLTPWANREKERERIKIIFLILITFNERFISAIVPSESCNSVYADMVLMRALTRVELDVSNIRELTSLESLNRRADRHNSFVRFVHACNFD